MAAGEKSGFQLTTSLSPHCVLTAVDSQLRSQDCALCGVTAQGTEKTYTEARPARIELHLPPDRQHFWSPALTIDVCTEKGATRLQGRFGAAPSLFSLYVAILAVSLFAAFVGLSFAYAQWVLGVAPTGLWALPCSMLPVALLSAASWIGKSGGRAQMAELRSFLEASLETAATDLVDAKH